MMQPIQPPQQPTQNTNSYFPQYPNPIPNNVYQYPPNQPSRYMPMPVTQAQGQQIQNIPVPNAQQTLQPMNVGFSQNPYNQFNQRNASPAQIQQIQGQWPLGNTVPPINNISNINSNPMTPVSSNKMINNPIINQMYGYNAAGQGTYGQFNTQNYNQINKYGQNYPTQNPQFMQQPQTPINQIPIQGHYQNQPLNSVPIQNQYLGSQHQQYQSPNMGMNMNMNIPQNNYNYNPNPNMSYSPTSSIPPNPNPNTNHNSNTSAHTNPNTVNQNTSTNTHTILSPIMNNYNPQVQMQMNVNIGYGTVYEHNKRRQL